MSIFAKFNADGAAFGFYHVEDDKQPSGTVRITEVQWKDLVGNLAYRRWNGSKIVSYTPPSPLSPAGRTAKADIWRRATDAEAARIMAGLDSLPLRKRQIYNDATYLDHSDPLFDELASGFIAAFGEARTSELLAVSE